MSNNNSSSNSNSNSGANSSGGSFSDGLTDLPPCYPKVANNFCFDLAIQKIEANVPKVLDSVSQILPYLLLAVVISLLFRRL